MAFVISDNVAIKTNTFSLEVQITVPVVESNLVLPKPAPYFLENLEEVLLFLGDKKKLTYKFPEIHDVNVDETQNITIGALKDYEYIVLKDRELIFD